MKAGDQGWAFGTVDRVFNDGTFIVSASCICEDQDLLPDNPALPAVARWLAEHGDEHLRELLECAVWVITNGGIEYEQVEYGQALINMANALLAALTTEEPA